MLLFNLKDVKTEIDAENVLIELTDEAIETKCEVNMRSKRRKITRVQAQIEMLQTKCEMQGWKKVFSEVSELASKVKDAVAQADARLW